MIQSRLFLLRDNDFIHGALADLKLCRSCVKVKIISKIHIGGTLIKYDELGVKLSGQIHLYDVG